MQEPQQTLLLSKNFYNIGVLFFFSLIYLLFEKPTTLEAKKEFADSDFYVCKVCGNTVEASAPERCSICGAPKEQFEKIQ